MTTKFTSTLLACTLLTTLLAPGQDAPDPTIHGDPYIPVGKLSVNPTIVATGVKTNLTWDIEYPTAFDDLALVGPSGSIATTQQVLAEIRVLGVALKDDERGGDLPVALWVRTGGAGSAWKEVFQGKAADVNPSKVLHKEWVDPGTQIDIAAKGQSPSGTWNESVWTIDSTARLAHLKNGSPLPSHVPAFTTGELEGFTSTIVSDDDSTVEIGPKDMAYFFELTAEDPAEPAFDMQDVVVLVQFGTKNNNGHGNNEDGVDVSNPSSGTGGANGVEEGENAEDDEIKSEIRTSTTTTL